MSDGSEASAEKDADPRPPERLKGLVSWQASKVSTLGARLHGRRMPLGARSDFAVLATLEQEGAISQADLGRILGLDRNAVNGIVSRLDQAGCIARNRDPENRRRNRVALTPAGQRRLEALQADTDEVQDELLAGLSATQRRQLQQLLALVLAHHGGQPA